jgi:hypothetical protein
VYGPSQTITSPFTGEREREAETEAQTQTQTQTQTETQTASQAKLNDFRNPRFLTGLVGRGVAEERQHNRAQLCRVASLQHTRNNKKDIRICMHDTQNQRVRKRQRSQARKKRLTMPV